MKEIITRGMKGFKTLDLTPTIEVDIDMKESSSEIERMDAKLLEASIIQPSETYFYAPVVLVHKNDGSWHMCPDYKELNKLIIKYKFPIPDIDEFLDELQLFINVM